MRLTGLDNGPAKGSVVFGPARAIAPGLPPSFAPSFYPAGQAHGKTGLGVWNVNDKRMGVLMLR